MPRFCGSQLLHCPFEAEPDSLKLGTLSEYELSDWEDKEEDILHRGRAGTVRSRSFTRNVFAKGYPIMYTSLLRSIPFSTFTRLHHPPCHETRFWISVSALGSSPLSNIASALGLRLDCSRGSRPKRSYSCSAGLLMRPERYGQRTSEANKCLLDATDGLVEMQEPAQAPFQQSSLSS